MSRQKFRSILQQLVYLQALTVAGMLLLGALLTLLVVRVTTLNEEDARLRALAQELALVWAQGEEEEMDAIAAREDALVEVVALGYANPYSADAKWEPYKLWGQENTRLISLMNTARDAAQVTGSYFRNGEKPFPVRTAYIRAGSDRILLVHADTSAMNKQILDLMAWMFGILFLGCALTVLICYSTAGRIVRPFVRINHAVQCYVRGDFSRRIKIDGRDEAAQLARTFNELAEQLKQLEETRKSFVSNVSHELRSPLASITGFVDAMRDGTIPRSEFPHYLNVVSDEARRMRDMINDILDLGRMEAGYVKLEYSMFDVNELIRRILVTFEPRIAEKRQEVRIRFSEEQSFVYADATQIGQVIRNLMDNAIKYTAEGKQITVTTYPQRQDICVAVRDSGVGIPQEDLPKVFERFYKVEKAHTPSAQVGSGLGLSLVKRIIEEHEQNITVKSAKGRGTQFTFTLQKAEPPKRRG